MAKILITGGTGFIGFHLTRALLDQGHAVRCMVRKSSKLDRLAGLPVRRDDGDVTARPLAQAHAHWRATVDTSASVLPAILSRPIDGQRRTDRATTHCATDSRRCGIVLRCASVTLKDGK